MLRKWNKSFTEPVNWLTQACEIKVESVKLGLAKLVNAMYNKSSYHKGDMVCMRIS